MFQTNKRSWVLLFQGFRVLFWFEPQHREKGWNIPLCSLQSWSPPPLHRCYYNVTLSWRQKVYWYCHRGVSGWSLKMGMSIYQMWGEAGLSSSLELLIYLCYTFAVPQASTFQLFIRKEEKLFIVQSCARLSWQNRRMLSGRSMEAHGIATIIRKSAPTRAGRFSTRPLIASLGLFSS